MERYREGVRLFSVLITQTALIATTGCNFTQNGPHKFPGTNFVSGTNLHADRIIGDNERPFKVIGSTAYLSEVSERKILPPREDEAINFLDRLKDTTYFPEELEDYSESQLTTFANLDGDMSTHASRRARRSHAKPLLRKRANAKPVAKDSLVVGFPIALLNKAMFFGSTITRVSDPESTELGMLKIAHIPPLQVLPIIFEEKKETYSMVLLLCKDDCSKIPEKPTALFKIPIVGADPQANLLVLDLASLGEIFDLEPILEGLMSLKGYQSELNKTSAVDFSDSTLVFDVETTLVPTEDAEISPAKKRRKTSSNALSTKNVIQDKLMITNRWYMVPVESFNTSFLKRPPAEGVGFFQTFITEQPFINRWDFDRRGAQDGIKYFIKNVPDRFQPAFAAAFEEWNDKLFPILGKRTFNYEFISAEDPRGKLLVAGDIRYNIVEWDLDNRAGYGGFGPSIAHPYTGEIKEGTILVQGPAVVDTYTRWFKANEKAANLRSRGFLRESDELLVSEHRMIQANLGPTQAKGKFRISLGHQVELIVPSQSPSFEDPIISMTFDPIPSGSDFDSYMFGYFKEMLAHELGHNLGLRHNFKGNLGSVEGDPSQGQVSRSIMEYLGRTYRHLNAVGEYDLMAVSYGYAGTEPTHKDWFCTDEDVANIDDPAKSAECSRDDATQDPFGFFQKRLDRSLEMLIARGQRSAPTVGIADLKSELSSSILGLGTYAGSAESTSHTWTNFFSVPGRPTLPSDIRNYSLAAIKGILCSPDIETELENKMTRGAKDRAVANIIRLREVTAYLLQPIFTEEELSCYPPKVMASNLD